MPQGVGGTGPHDRACLSPEAPPDTMQHRPLCCPSTPRPDREAVPRPSVLRPNFIPKWPDAPAPHLPPQIERREQTPVAHESCPELHPRGSPGGPAGASHQRQQLKKRSAAMRPADGWSPLLGLGSRGRLHTVTPNEQAHTVRCSGEGPYTTRGGAAARFSVWPSNAVLGARLPPWFQSKFRHLDNALVALRPYRTTSLVEPGGKAASMAMN